MTNARMTKDGRFVIRTSSSDLIRGFGFRYSGFSIRVSLKRPLGSQRQPVPALLPLAPLVELVVLRDRDGLDELGSEPLDRAPRREVVRVARDPDGVDAV